MEYLREIIEYHGISKGSHGISTECNRIVKEYHGRSWEYHGITTGSKECHGTSVEYYERRKEYHWKQLYIYIADMEPRRACMEYR